MSEIDKTMEDAMRAYDFFNQLAERFNCKAEVDIYNKVVNFTGNEADVYRLMAHISEYLD